MRWLFHIIFYHFLESICYHNSWKLFDFLSNVLVYMEYQQVYPDDSGYHGSQDGDYVHGSPDYYSDSNNSYDSSFKDDNELDDDATILRKPRITPDNI